MRLGYDCGDWCAELYRRGQFLRRIGYGTLRHARAEVERIQANGLQRLPDARPHWTSVAYGDLSDGSLDNVFGDLPRDLLDDGGDAA